MYVLCFLCLRRENQSYPQENVIGFEMRSREGMGRIIVISIHLYCNIVYHINYIYYVLYIARIHRMMLLYCSGETKF